MDEIQKREQMIRDLTGELISPVTSTGDWKVIKCYEYFLAGEELPYDVEELHTKRQEIRDRINELQAEIDELNGIVNAENAWDVENTNDFEQSVTSVL